jgi:hypothetical protein
MAYAAGTRCDFDFPGSNDGYFHGHSFDQITTYRDGGFDGPEKVMRPRGFVRDGTSNAVWGMQFVWPVRSEYLIAHVDPEYRETIIGRSKRDYVWIMARTPTIPAEDYARLEAKVAALGYDVAKLQKVPQRWDVYTARPTASRSLHDERCYFRRTVDGLVAGAASG